MSTSRSIKLALISIATIILPVIGKAQFNYAGKHFFFAIPDLLAWTYVNPIYSAPRNINLGISSKHRATVQLHFFNTQAGNASTRTIVVNPGEVVRCLFDYREAGAIATNRYTDVEVIRNKSLEIVSDSDIIINAIVWQPMGDDGTYLMPVDNQPKIDKYYISSTPSSIVSPSPDMYLAEIVAACDSTVLKITPSCNTAFHSAHVPFNLTLQKGDTYVLRSYGNQTLMGTEIEILYSNMNMPINVVTGDEGRYVPPGICCADITWEQLLPVAFWDTLVPVSMMYLQNWQSIRILSADNNNPIYFDNKLVTTQNKGAYFDTLIADPFIIHAGKPVGVVMFMPSCVYPGGSFVGDPDMIWMFSPDQGIKESYFRLLEPVNLGPIYDTNKHLTVDIVSRKTDINDIRFDNNGIANLFHPFPHDSLWQYAQVHLDSMDTVTVHHIISPERILARFVQVYTYGGYSYNLSDPNTYPSITEDIVANKCANSKRILKAPDGTYFYHWSTGATTSQIYVSDTGHYRLDSKRITGCDEATEQYDFYVSDVKLPHVNFSDNHTCPGAGMGKITLVATDTNTLSYKWKNASGGVLAEHVSNTGDSLAGLQFGDYVIEVSSGNGCDTVVTVPVTVLPVPRASFDVDTVICVGEQVQLNNTSDTGSYNWNLGNSLILTDRSPVHTYYRTGKYLVTLIVTSTDNCKDTAEHSVTVKEFDISLTSDKEYADKGSMVMLTSGSAQQYDLLAWRPSYLFSSQQLHQQSIVIDSTHEFIVIGQSLDGCIDTAAVTVNVIPEVFIPSAFTPNGDALNDYFRPLCSGPMSIQSLIIYDRWGSVVWKGDPNGETRGWDGTYDGVPAQLGVYYYTYRVVLLGGKDVTGKGEVTLIR